MGKTFYEDVYEHNVKSGRVPAPGEGFWGELGKGAVRSTVGALKTIGAAAEEMGLGPSLRKWSERTLRTNQQWNPPPNPTTGEWIGDGFGCGLAYTWPILLFLLVRFVPRSIARVKRERQHKKQQSSEAGAAALSELEAGTPDKALWAQALVAAKGDEKTARAEYIRLRMKNPVK